MSDDEEPPLKKNKLPVEEPTLIPSLPEELILSILARVSRLSYRSLSLVCKRFHSLLTSGEIYRFRSLSGYTENCLYVCLRFSHTGRSHRWFMLREKNKSSGYVLAPIPISHSPSLHASSIVAVGSKIYKIGGVMDGSSVSILDCWSHRWLEAPSMQMERDRPSANLIDGKIYVTGGCHRGSYNPSKWMEVFDLKTETWEPVLCRSDRLTFESYHERTNNLLVDGKLYIFWADKGVVYNPKDDTWDSLEVPEMDMCLTLFYCCVIENVLYDFFYEELDIKWYDTKARTWRSLLNGMRELHKFVRHASVTLADYGGKMVMFWDKFVASGDGLGFHKTMMWCAMIALERSDSGEIWGKVEWFGPVLPNQIPLEYAFEYVGSVKV
ncbi:Hypothetical protein [Arabidopsis thaliana]|uniref:Putative F-box/kelch-repeat protein At1g60570 n=1 Tax=Arabidopsis thaliana TaxID=3702 RepID=FBK24_ARATH|nr:Galactose oxidase/kelch repeat superfamily protein [Arabidopsis thaliana]O22698.1 RecName: Full=Putative F-box/kelch-repeat protein At1g60570 [Arabidopsis thaliana]AAB71958.1 Hypothetical protein [Arabidopsis thaliana]AEE33699.1 Galactose oxidase/kelch repeat superfamily protein [Arabidopsis thaliana]|eukprot:NP_176257.1 Galactose oxidase/kelch repeat superfamily protein [Arabidopsis thaliana]